MVPESSAKKLIGYAFLVVFGNDDTISEEELKMLKRIALEDNIIDEDEKRILGKIFSRVTKEQVTGKVWAEMEKFRSDYNI